MRDELAALLNQVIPDGRENVMVHCPLHEDRRPSLSLNLTKGVWWCHACGKGGGVRRLAQMLGGDLDAADLAVRTLRLEPDKPDPDFGAHARDCADFLSEFGNWPVVVLDYLNKKKLPTNVVTEFDLGYDEERGAMSFPYWDNGRCLSIQYRYPDGSRSQESGGKRGLYNVDALRGAEYVVLCEGESDTHRMWAELQMWGHTDIAVGGVPGAASGNKRWELWSLDLLWAERIVIAFDADEAGDKGADQALRALGDKAVRLRPEGGNDWCDDNTDWSWLSDLP